MKFFSLQAAMSIAVLSSSVAFTTGCGVSPLDAAKNVVAPGVPLTGTVFGGQQPITGAHLYLMAANTTAYGAASTSLITTGNAGSDSIGKYVVTDTNGAFNLTGTYSCTPGQQVYLMSYGGNPGLTAGTNNTAAVLVAVLGACPSNDTFAGHISGINLNEVSTVAAAFAMAGYAVDFQHVSSSTTAASIAGMATAFATSSNLVSLSGGGAFSKTPALSGFTGALSANGVVPQAKINTLANILAGCVNSTGGGNACTQLWNNAKTLSGGAVPTNTFDAMLNIAHNPGANVAALLALNTTTAPFNPALSTTPNDWTIAIKFSVPNSSVPGRVAVDALGNVWIPNSGNNTLTELSPLGGILSGTAGYKGGGMSEPITPAFDSTGNVWIANMGSGAISKFSSTGAALSTSGYATSGNGAGYGIVIDPTTSYAWMSGDNAIATVNATGGIISSLVGTTYNTAIIKHSNGNQYSTSYNYNSITEYVQKAPVSFTGGGLSSPTSLAADSSGNLWVANAGNSSISHFSAAGVAMSASGITGGGVNAAWAIAVDGQNNVWVGNNNGTISRFSSTGTAVSPTTGYSTAITANGVTTSSTAAVYGVTADQAGNLWVPNTDGNIYEFVGLAAPTNGAATPAQAGTRP